MRNVTYRLVSRVSHILGSKVFFIGIVVIFVLQALWLAFSAAYPMPFDEEYHVGVIKIYAEQWSPFLTQQPAGSESFGSLVSEPSYLFHYLMSFPYRFVAAISDNVPVQVISLRVLNIALFAAALVVFRKVMLRVLSPRLTHLSLALLTLIPVVPFLAAQVNYDNALVLVTAALAWLGVRLVDDIQAKQINVMRLGAFIGLSALGCLIKYTLLPIVVGIVLFLSTYGYIVLRRDWSKVRRSIGGSWRKSSLAARLAVAALLIIGCGLFIHKYGTNTVQYGSPIPKCHAVLTEAQCMSFGPWGRNKGLSESKRYVNPNPFAYAVTWTDGLAMRLFFTLGSKEIGYPTRKPLPLPIFAAGLVVITGIICIAARPQLLRDPYLCLFGTITVVYCTALFLDNYSQYLFTGQPVAVNGRYLIPLIPLIAVLLGRGYQEVFGGWLHAKVALTVVVTFCFLQGGGFMTFIVRSESAWYWQHPLTINVNEAAQRVLQPFLIEGSKK